MLAVRVFAVPFSGLLNEKQREFPAPPWTGGEARHSNACSVSSTYCSTTSSDTAPVVPRIPSQQVLARPRLELPSDVCQTVLWACLHEQVYVVVHNLIREAGRSRNDRQQIIYVVWSMRGCREPPFEGCTGQCSLMGANPTCPEGWPDD